jgi:hypothetical protein
MKQVRMVETLTMVVEKSSGSGMSFEPKRR